MEYYDLQKRDSTTFLSADVLTKQGHKYSNPST